MIKLNINLKTYYFLVAGILFKYSTFNTRCNTAIYTFTKQADLVVDPEGTVVKNRGNAELSVIQKSIQEDILGEESQVYICVVDDESIKDYTPERFLTMRQVAASVRAAYK